jgi:hypothetical protein
MEKNVILILVVVVWNTHKFTLPKGQLHMVMSVRRKNSFLVHFEVLRAIP